MAIAEEEYREILPATMKPVKCPETISIVF
jgi:hypothetical protein